MDILSLAKAQQDAYKAAFDAGYKCGFDDACAEGMVILNKPKASGFMSPEERALVKEEARLEKARR